MYGEDLEKLRKRQARMMIFGRAISMAAHWLDTTYVEAQQRKKARQ